MKSKQFIHFLSIIPLLTGSFLTMTTAQANDNELGLTVERIYADPSLDGPELRKVKLSPDGKQIGRAHV